MRPRSAVLVATLVAAACVAPGAGAGPVSTSRAAMAPLVVGCWALTWRTDGAVSGAEPDSIRLREGAVFGTGERLVSPATHPNGRELVSGAAGPAPWESRFRVNRWWIEGDALSLRFSDGADDEWRVRLEVEGRGLRGDASRDAPSNGTPHRAEVTAARIACDFA